MSFLYDSQRVTQLLSLLGGTLRAAGLTLQITNSTYANRHLVLRAAGKSRIAIKHYDGPVSWFAPDGSLMYEITEDAITLNNVRTGDTVTLDVTITLNVGA
jgi:hypothetical protein